MVIKLCDDTSVEKIKKPQRGGTLVDKITKKIKEPQSGETLVVVVRIETKTNYTIRINILLCNRHRIFQVMPYILL